MFAEEIKNERKELQELNLQAQKFIASHLEASTQVLDHSNPGMVTGVMSNMRVMPNMLTAGVPGIDLVGDRLMKIEAMMKQKASGRHYVMLAFYVLSLVALKLDDKFSVLNFLFPQQEVAAVANIKPAGPAKNPNKQLHTQQRRVPANTNQIKAQNYKQKHNQKKSKTY